MTDYDDAARDAADAARWAQYMADEKAKLDGLRARARKLGLTIKSGRGTATGHYHLCWPGDLFANPSYGVTRISFRNIQCLDGLGELEGWVADLEAELGGIGVKPTTGQVVAAVTAISERRWAEEEARARAKRELVCTVCGQPPDGSAERGTGMEGHDHVWMHERCVAAYREQCRREYEAWRGSLS